jgi:hypothetical protein
MTMKQSKFLESFEQFKKGLEKLYWKKNPDWYLQFKRFDDEEFKEIKGYYGLYFISNYGQVVSFHKKLPQLLNPGIGLGFLLVSLSLNRSIKRHYVHDLVYKTFVGPKRSNRRIIHKNGVLTDNYYKNLKVVMVPPPKRKLRPLKENAAVLQFDKKGRYARQYPSIEAASINTGIPIYRLKRCLRGFSKSIGGYQWRCKDDKAFKKGISDIEALPVRTSYKARRVLKFDLKGNFIEEYPSFLAAAEDLECTIYMIYSRIARKIPALKKFQLRFADDPLFENGIVNIPPAEPIEPSKRKPVLQFDLEGNFIKEFPSLSSSARKLGITIGSISACIREKSKTAGDFQWKLKSDPLFTRGIVNIGPVYYDPSKPCNRGKRVLQFTKKGKFIRKYRSIKEASQEVGISRSVINDCILGKGKTAAGFQWRAARGKEWSQQKVNDIEPVKYKPSCRERAVLQFDLKGYFIREYRNAAEAARKTNSEYNSIKACASGKYKSAGNFLWRYRNDPLFKDGIVNIDPLPPPVYARSKAVLQFDLEGNFVKEYPSVSTALREIGVKGACISNCALGKGKTALGFQWKYKNDPRFANGIGKIEPLTYPDRSEPVLQFDWQGKFINEFDSAVQAARVLNADADTIRCCCCRKNKIYKTFLFRYKRDVHWPVNKKNPPSIEPFKGKILRQYPPIFQFSREGKFIAKFSSAKEASEKLGINAMCIRRCLAGEAKTSAGFQWRPSDDPLFKNGITGIPPVP